MVGQCRPDLGSGGLLKMQWTGPHYAGPLGAFSGWSDENWEQKQRCVPCALSDCPVPAVTALCPQ